jgi:hypothetical protein
MFINILRNKQSNEIVPFFEGHLKGGLDRLGDRLKRDFKDYFVQ